MSELRNLLIGAGLLDRELHDLPSGRVFVRRVYMEFLGGTEVQIEVIKLLDSGQISVSEVMGGAVFRLY